MLTKCSHKDYAASFSVFLSTHIQNIIFQSFAWAIQTENQCCNKFYPNIYSSRVSNGWSASLRRAVVTGAAAPPWKNQSVLQASNEPRTHTSSSTERRCEDSASFSKLAEGNTGAITPPLPNPQITLIQKSIQMVERAIGQALFRSRFKPCLILHKPFHLSKIQILHWENCKINHYCSLMDCQEIRAECYTQAQ